MCIIYVWGVSVVGNDRRLIAAQRQFGSYFCISLARHGDAAECRTGREILGSISIPILLKKIRTYFSINGVVLQENGNFQLTVMYYKRMTHLVEQKIIT